MHKGKKNVTFIFMLFFGIALFNCIGSDGFAEDGCVTDKCHQPLPNAQYLHPVTDPCEMCHEAVAQKHPQKTEKTFKLAQELPGLCTQCHSGLDTESVVHAPVKQGMCTACHNLHAGERKLLVKPIRELCVSCHIDKSNYKFFHGPAAASDCMSCHNPHQSKNQALLVKEGAGLCFSCHTGMEEKIKKKYMHQALATGCTSCHSPHGSASKMFFPAPGAGLCYQCHGNIETQLQSAKSIHPPIKSEHACASCHAPHSSEMEKLLPKSGKDFCLDCHTDLIKKKQTVLHGPIKDGQCTPCHDPHGTAEDKLLIKSFPRDFYVSYTEKEFQLCFSCHNRDLLRNPTTGYATQFRDGERNLHYIHVNRKEKGRNCKSCHVIHAGETPKLIADGVPFGKWNLPLRYVKTETGGSCAPGCHKKYSYDRKQPGKEAEAPKKETKKEKAKKNEQRR